VVLENIYFKGEIDSLARWEEYTPLDEIPNNFKTDNKIGDLVIFSGYLLSTKPSRRTIFHGD
jgi:hypothetical protein